LPWIKALLFFLIFIYMGGILYYGILFGLRPLFLIFIFIPLFIFGSLFDTSEEIETRAGRGSVVWVIVFIIYSLSYFGGSGIYNYLPSFADDIIFKILYLGGALLVLKSSGTLDGSILSKIGIRRGSTTNAIAITFVGTLLFLPVFVGAGVMSVYEMESIDYWILNILIGSILTGFVEEITFRGIIQEQFALRYKSRLSGLLMGSTVFAFAHIWTNVGVHNDFFLGLVTCVASQFFGGLLLGFIYEKTDTVLPGIVIHALYNTFVLVNISQGELNVVMSYFIIGWLLASFLVILRISWPTLKKVPSWIYDFYHFLCNLCNCIKKCLMKNLGIKGES